MLLSLAIKVLAFWISQRIDFFVLKIWWFSYILYKLIISFRFASTIQPFYWPKVTIKWCLQSETFCINEHLLSKYALIIKSKEKLDTLWRFSWLSRFYIFKKHLYLKFMSSFGRMWKKLITPDTSVIIIIGWIGEKAMFTILCYNTKTA